ncbi:MAG: RnfABCDGE type electron transport complex subunit G [Pseudomonadota bacterium]
MHRLKEQIWFMVLVLGGISVVAGALLAGVKGWTDPIIEKNMLEQKIKPSLDVFFEPLGLDNDPIADRVKLELGRDDMGRLQQLTVFKGKKGGAIVAVAMTTTTASFGGDLTVLTAIDVAKGTVLGVKALDCKDTPGLGARVVDGKEPFILQWPGQPIAGGVALTSDGGKVDAISGATISSDAFTAAVNRAITLLGEKNAEIMGE